MERQSGISRPFPILLWILVAAALAAAHLTLALNGVFFSDSGRDIAVAHKIVLGETFPLIGPMVGGTVHLGPLYYYLIAFPLGLFGTATSVLCFLSLLSLIALPFAYGIGRLLFNSRVAALFVLLYSGDFLFSLSGVTVGNEALLPLASLALLYAACAAFITREPGYLAWALVAAAAGLQIHPTIVCLLPFLLIAALLPMPAGRRKSLLVGLGLAALLSLPYLLYQASHGWEDLRHVLAYAGQQMPATAARSPMMSLPVLFWRDLFYSAFMAEGYSGMVEPRWMRDVGVGAAYAVSLLALVGMAVAAIQLFQPGQRRGPGLAFLWLFCGWLVIPHLRPQIAWYYLHPVHPALSLFAAVALDYLAGGRRRLPYILASVLFVSTVWLPPVSFRTFSRLGFFRTPESLTARNSDLYADAQDFPGETVMPYPGARQDEEMTQKVLELGAGDPDILRKIHGLPLWSLIQSRGALFLLHGDERGKDKETRRPIDSQAHYLGILQADLQGMPVGGALSIGPLRLLRFDSSLDYSSINYTYEPDSSWRPVSVPTYAFPNAMVAPPDPDHMWEKTPVFIRGRLQPPKKGKLLFGVAFPAPIPWLNQAVVEELMINGRSVGPPWRAAPHLTLYDVTPYVTEQGGRFSLKLGGPNQFVLDLFAIEIEDSSEKYRTSAER